MKKYYLFFTLFIASILVTISCGDEDTYEPVSPVTVDLTQVPYPKLSDYKFFEGDLKNQNPSLNVLPYQPASALFTDYAHKKRFVWMPKGTSATYDADNKILDLPVGSVLIKTFYYDNVQPSNTTRIIETRLMIRKANEWIFAEYIWNDEQTEAYLDETGNGGFANITFMDDNNQVREVPNYRIPSTQQCMTCHKLNEKPIPIAIKPQNLNTNYTFKTGTKNQLQKWIEVGYLQNTLPQNIVSTIDYTDESQPLNLRVRSYLDMNCAHCHQNNSHCDYRPMRFAFSETTSAPNLGICVDTQDMNDFPAELSSIVNPGMTARSMLYYRLNTTEENYRMPLLGRTVIHDEAVQMIEQWINSLTGCN